MNTSESTTIASGKVRPIRRVLASIRRQLAAAAVLAAVDTMFTLVPLAGIAHIAMIVLDDSTVTAAAPVGIWWAVGAIVEQGTHKQLLAQGGRYARLWIKGGTAQNDSAPAEAQVQPC